MHPMNQDMDDVFAANLPTVVFAGLCADRTEDERLLAAAQTSISTGTTTPVVKAELRCRIMKRRHEEGLPELPADSAPCQQYELSPAELEKRERRKEQNRRAAKKCRLRKRSRHQQAEEGFQRAKTRNEQLLSERDKLCHFLNALQSFLVSHLAVCTLRLPAQTSPAPPPSDSDQQQCLPQPSGCDPNATTTDFRQNSDRPEACETSLAPFDASFWQGLGGGDKPPPAPGRHATSAHDYMSASEQHVHGASLADADVPLDSADIVEALRLLVRETNGVECTSTALQAPTDREPVAMPPTPPPSATPPPSTTSHILSTQMLDLPGYPWGTFHDRKSVRSTASSVVRSVTGLHLHEHATVRTAKGEKQNVQYKLPHSYTTSVTPPESPETRREVPSPALPSHSPSPSLGFFQDWQDWQDWQVPRDCPAQAPGCQESEASECGDGVSDWFTNASRRK